MGSQKIATTEDSGVAFSASAGLDESAMASAQKFQHYEVDLKADGSPFELGRGAMGITYKAYDTNLRCPVALKVITHTYLNSAIAQQRFFREARAAAALKHPNVASVFHLGQEGDNFFYAMEFVEGETVDSLLRRDGPIPVVKALQIALQVNRALGAAHKQGLVHRDLKPANIMIQADSDSDLVVKLIDFGLAKSAIKEAADATITMQGFLGTPHFASPEQLEEKDVDIRSDIYSLGVTLWCMLLGKTPYSGSLAQVMSQHLYKPVPLDQLAGFSPSVVALMRHMLEKEPEKRPQNPAALRKEIEDCLADPDLKGLGGEVDLENLKTLAAEPTTEHGYAAAQAETLLDEIPKYPATSEKLIAASETFPATSKEIVTTNEKLVTTSKTFPATSEKLVTTTEKLVATSETFPATTEEIVATSEKIPPTDKTFSATNNPPPQPPPVPTSVAPAIPPPLQTHHASRGSGKIVILLVAALLFFAALGGGAWFVLQKMLKPKVVQNGLPTPANETPMPTPVLSSPTPLEIRTPEPTPEPTPDPVTLYKTALAQVETLNPDGRNAVAEMRGYLDLLEKYPDRDELRKRLEGIVARLIRDESPLEPEEFARLQPVLESAATVGIGRAQLLLAQNIRTTEPDRALDLFEAAARTGNVSAMRQAGLLYSVRNNAGDMQRAVALFEQGSVLGDTACKLAAGETYLLGKGVPRDVDKGISYLQEAAANDEPRAWDRLGDYYNREKDYAKALDAFNHARALDWVPALANLGALYMNGSGVPADPKRADALFAEGAEKGDARAMFFHAQCLEAGLGTIQNLDAAHDWYRKAAAAGDKRAAAWLQKKGE